MWRLWLVHYCARRGLLGTWCSGTPVMAWGCAPAPGGFSSSLALLFFPRWAPARSLTFGNGLQLSTMDVLACASRKGAAKCDKHCELQNSVSRQGLEHILCFWDIPKSMPASVSLCVVSAPASSHIISCCDLLSLKS